MKLVKTEKSCEVTEEALRLAKLDYIKTAEGRTKQPKYWAGLVIIGDTTPFDIQTISNHVFWLSGLIFIIVLALIIKRKYNV